MARLTKASRAMASFGLLLLGVLQLSWAFWVLVEGSLHMGSPLRRIGPLILGLASEASAHSLARTAYQTGILGFQLLETSLIVLAVGGLALVAAGLATAAPLFASNVAPNNSFKPTAGILSTL